MAEIISSAPRDGEWLLENCEGWTRIDMGFGGVVVDYKNFLTILNRPDGFKPAGTPGMVPFVSGCGCIVDGW